MSRRNVKPVLLLSPRLDLTLHIQRPDIYRIGYIVSLSSAQLVELIPSPPQHIRAPIRLVLRTLFTRVEISYIIHGSTRMATSNRYP